MSAAYKYAAFQAFAIPTEGDNDADATTHEVAAVNLDGIKQSMLDAPNLDALQAHFKTAWLMLDKAQQEAVKPVYDARKAELTEVAALKAAMTLFDMAAQVEASFTVDESTGGD